jgi:hypothetical protein
MRTGPALIIPDEHVEIGNALKHCPYGGRRRARPSIAMPPGPSTCSTACARGSTAICI